MTEPKQVGLTHYVRCSPGGTPDPMTTAVQEPDFIRWVEVVDEYRMRCEMIRVPTGTWCAYVSIPEGHAWRSLNTGDEIPGMDDAHEVAHGGVTWFRDSLVGFDCAHLYDAKPGEWDEFSRYRDAAYVMRCTRRLAAVVYAMRNAGGAS